MNEWKKVKLGDLFERVTRKNTNLKSENVLTISAQYGLINQEEFFNKSVAGKNLKSYYLLKKGEFAYNKSYSAGYPMGATKMLEKYDYGVVSSLYICFKSRSDLVNNEYFKYYFESKQYYDELSKIAQEGARNHGLLNVSSEDFFNINIFLPSIEEQEKIVKILDNINKIIALNNDKLLKINNWRMYIEKKIFLNGIKNESNKQTEIGKVPATWKINKLNEIAEYVDYRGKTPKKVDKGIVLVTAKNIKKGYIDYEISKEYIEEQNYNNVMARGRVTIGDVLITTEAPCGNVAQVDNESIALAQRVIKYRGKDNIIVNEYLKYYMLGRSFQSRLSRLSTGGTAQGIKGSVLHQMLIAYPSIEEQEEIIKVLKFYDELEKLFNRKINYYKQLEQALMQKLLTGKVRVKI